MENMISVIIPVYNVEKYLNKCISSIVSQSYTNLEIILVDDGSSDKSGEICDKWSEIDSRIRVIHKENAGAGVARNVGLKMAQGKFIAFVDSDDYIALNMYEILMTCFNENIDIVECDYLDVEENNNDAIWDKEEVKKREYDVEEAMKEHIENHFFRQLIWNKLYRRECVENVFFPSKKKIDDEFWTYKVLGRAQNLVHISKRLYAYRQQDNSVMHTLTSINRMQAVEAKLCRHLYIKERFPRLIINSYYDLVMTCIYQGQKVCKEGDRNRIQNVIEYCQDIIRKNIVKRNGELVFSMKQKMWLYFAEKSLINVCKIRNFLNIGM